MSEPSHDVVVVGAGLAGLATALRLIDKGHEPLVLEQSDRPGGRVATDEVDGFLLDRGFQILLTAYPESERLLDYDALHLRRFEPGAVVHVDGRFHRVADPFRSPGDAFASLRAPVGGLRDKLAILRFRRELRQLDVEEIFTRPDTTAQARLEEAGFSERMIDRFFRPLFSGIALDPTLSFSSRSLEFVFQMLSEGDAAVPSTGMGAIPAQLAAQLPAGTIRYGATVEEVRDHHVVVDGEKFEANAVVVATDATDAARLTHDETEDPGVNSLTTWWMTAPEPPVHRPVIVLDATPGSPVNNLAVMSQVAPTYSPDDRALIAVSAPSIEVKETDVRRRLGELYGSIVEHWETLRVDVIHRAQPRQEPGVDPDQAVRLSSGLFVAGDHRQHASINGALMSGRRAAEAVAARLCRDT